ncbi:MAG TPA: hypothetical protein VFG19_02140 [Geobacteraceae bacterium]|nr:hypothetical protein [Geobacteraceae bacterium]
MTKETRQLETILSMMSSGQRCIRMERHSLIMWGITGAFLCISPDILIPRERFDTGLQHMTALLILLVTVLSGVTIADLHYMRYRKQARGESFPFIHAQVSKVWWLLFAMGTLFTFGSGFFGGCYMIYGVWLILIGFGLFVHGLFSEQMLEWAGMIMILLGIGPLALKANFEFTKWLAAGVFAVGLPALSFLPDERRGAGILRQAARFSVWLLLVLAPPLIGWHYMKMFHVPDVPDAPVVSLQEYLRQKPTAAPRIVALPSGVTVPVRIRISGNIFRNGDAIMPLTLLRPVEIVLQNGNPTGRFRIAGEKWKDSRYYLSVWGNEDLRTQLTPAEGPVMKTGFLINVE